MYSSSFNSYNHVCIIHYLFNNALNTFLVLVKLVWVLLMFFCLVVLLGFFCWILVFFGFLFFWGFLFFCLVVFCVCCRFFLDIKC